MIRAGRSLIRTLFFQSHAPDLRLGVAVLLSLTLLGAERRAPELLAPAHSIAGFLGAPMHWLAAAPGNGGRWFRERFRTRQTLAQENRTLREELLAARGQLLSLEALQRENRELAQLLQGAGKQPPRTALAAQVRKVSSSPSRRWLHIDRGAADGLTIGMTGIDAHGVMGQLTKVWKNNARLLLLTDSRHAIAVYVERNGVRAIIEGDGSHTLALRHITHTTDIRVGDRLMSSGLGDRFPAGYPVAEVTNIQREADKPFLLVEARPIAHLQRSRRLLLLAREQSP